jgi:hypothetical protein
MELSPILLATWSNFLFCHYPGRWNLCKKTENSRNVAVVTMKEWDMTINQVTEEEGELGGRRNP